MPRPVAMIADAGGGAGLGHLSRSSAIAVALRCRGIEARCHAFGAGEAIVRDGIRWAPVGEGAVPSLAGHVLLIDSYRLSSGTISRLAESASIVLMHDQGPVPDGAAMVVSVAG